VTRRAVLVTLWNGPVVLGFSGPDPDAATLDRIARHYLSENCGVLPSARVVEHVAIPPYRNERQPTCEEQTGLTSGGRIEGQQWASLGRRT
jgi:hypothetical protein